MRPIGLSELGTQSRRTVAVILLGLVGLGMLYFCAPGQSAYYPPCPFHRLTGLHCPGCGTLRCLHALMHGEVATAFGHNPLTASLLPVLVILGCYHCLYAFGGRGPTRPRWSTSRLPAASIWGLFVVIVLFWILRNVPHAPFAGLAPG